MSTETTLSLSRCVPFVSSEIHLAIFSFYFLSVTWSPGNVQADATEMATKPFLERTAQSLTCEGAKDIYFLLRQ